MFAVLTHAQSSEERLARERAQLVSQVSAVVEQTARYHGRAKLDARVVDALRKVPRHRFVPPELAARAYEDRPLPIGEGQTISQPTIVAISTDLLEPKPEHVVLEIGTGSGYQAAVLAEIVRKVYTIELIEPLGRRADSRLRELGYRNVEVRIGDGYKGWPEKAPFDSIIVTAAPPEIPKALVAQLKVGGKMVVPVGPEGMEQELLVVTKARDGSITTRRALPVRFVPMVPGDKK